MIDAGRRSKWRSMMASIRSSSMVPVPNVSIDIEIGRAMPIGAAIGLLSGLTGVGGGIFLSPLLLMLGWAGTKQTSAVTAPFILVNSIAGLAAGLAAGTAALPPQIGILAGAVLIGGWLGAEFGSRRFANPLIRRVLGVVLALAGGKMVLV